MYFYIAEEIAINEYDRKENYVFTKLDSSSSLYLEFFLSHSSNPKQKPQ